MAIEIALYKYCIIIIIIIIKIDHPQFFLVFTKEIASK